MKTIDEAFRDGLRMVREAGFDVSGGHVAVLVAASKFEAACRDKVDLPGFDEQAPKYAKLLILKCLMVHVKMGK